MWQIIRFSVFLFGGRRLKSNCMRRILGFFFFFSWFFVLSSFNTCVELILAMDASALRRVWRTEKGAWEVRRTKGAKKHFGRVCLLGFINFDTPPPPPLYYLCSERTHTYTLSCTHPQTHKFFLPHTHTHTHCTQRPLNGVERQVDKQSILPPIQSSPLETGCYP